MKRLAEFSGVLLIVMISVSVGFVLGSVLTFQ